MRYLGGKSRTAKEISTILESFRLPGQTFVEPFCGACNITTRMSGVRNAYDGSAPLITLFKSLQDGWIPPEFVTVETYHKLKSKKDRDDPMTAFVGYGCSFGGKFFRGYASSGDRNYASNAKNSLLNKVKLLSGVTFKHLDYRELQVKNCLIYCDPPYNGTESYGAVDKFDSNEFWNYVRLWSKDNTVIISEYQAPEDFEYIWSKDVKTDMTGKDGKLARVEKLFVLKE